MVYVPAYYFNLSTVRSLVYIASMVTVYLLMANAVFGKSFDGKQAELLNGIAARFVWTTAWRRDEL